MTNKEAIAILNPLFEQCKGANGCLGYIEHYFSKEEETALDLAIKALEERPQGEWVPVSERLPDKSGLYLISVDDLVTVANFTGTYFMRRGGYVEADAWRALLEPYKPYKKGGVE